MTNAVTLPKDHFPDLKENLTKITWSHGVNSIAELAEALSNPLVMMLEADVILGSLTGAPNVTLPVMAHPPANSSDLSLEEFVKTMNEKGSKKGVKLDFKTAVALDNSSSILKKLNAEAKYPVFINADIFEGPVNAAKPNILPNLFVDAAKQYNNFILSIGWSTKPVGFANETQSKGYTDLHVKTAIDTLKHKEISQPITYAVRASLAAVSLDQMMKLTNSTEVKNATLTIWSDKDDKVDTSKLSEVIKKVGVKKVYLDVSDAVKAELKLDGSGASGVTITTMTLLGSLFVNYLLTAMPRRG